jgi:cell division protein FtsN
MYKVVLTLGLAILLGVSGCSRQQSDWEKTRAADATDAYELFLKKYPSGEFTSQAQARLKELYEERDWQKARDIDSAEAYQAFLKQYPEGKWSEEARIRIENFTLASAPSNSVAAASGVATPGGAPTSTANSAPEAAAPTPPPESEPAVAPAEKPKRNPAEPRVGAKAAEKHSAPSSDAYRVQLGAFKSGADAANQRWTHLSAKYPQILGGLAPKVTSRPDGAGTMYRLQVLNLSNKRAHSICTSLKAQSQTCVVLSPEHPKPSA